VTIAGSCYYCGPYEVDDAPGDPGPGEVLTPDQASAIFSRHMNTPSHLGMVQIADRIDASINYPRRKVEPFNPEEYA